MRSAEAGSSPAAQNDKVVGELKGVGQKENARRISDPAGTVFAYLFKASKSRIVARN